jgi:multicomponent Na+:H+ antiporter subunit F
MTVVVTVVLAVLSAAGLLTLVRLVRGPDTLDRIAALDVFVILIVAAAAVHIAYYEDGTIIPMLLAVALLGFVGTASATRLVEHRRRSR